MCSKTDRSQLFAIACWQEHEKINKIMAQVGTRKLKLSRSKRQGRKHHTLSFFYILCAFGKLKKSQFRFSEPEARKFKAHTA